MPDLAVQALALTIRHLKEFGFERILCSGASFRPFSSNMEMTLSANTLQQLEVIINCTVLFLRMFITTEAYFILACWMIQFFLSVLKCDNYKLILCMLDTNGSHNYYAIKLNCKEFCPSLSQRWSL